MQIWWGVFKRKILSYYTLLYDIVFHCQVGNLNDPGRLVWGLFNPLSVTILWLWGVIDGIDEVMLIEDANRASMSNRPGNH